MQRGEYNSYIVLMEADPLVITEGRDGLNTTQAKNRGQQLKASHTQAMRDAGVAPARIVNSYTTALNGFSALINYQQAVELAGGQERCDGAP